MSCMVTTAAALMGLLLLGLTAQDAFEVMLLPRRVLRRVRFASFFYRLTWAAWSALTQHFPPNSQREHFLAVFGPLSMALLFGVWVTGLTLGFGFLLWAVERPVLYQLFSRREAAVIRLDGRAGSPPTASGLLRRHGGDDGPGQIAMLLREWENWGSELLESHLSYPMLAYYRSQHDDQSWLAAVAVILDCCALILVGIDRVPPLQARMTFTMARQILVEMAKSFNVSPSRYTGGNRLDHEVFLCLERDLINVNFNWETAAEAEEMLAALRATYEPLLDGLGSYLLLSLPGWVVPDDARDHWVRGPRGTLAGRLVEELMLPGATMEPAGAGSSMWRRLRSRLRKE